MSEAREIWKSLFFLLANNSQPDDELPDMWAQFKKEHFQKLDLGEALESIKDKISESTRKELNKLHNEATTNSKVSLLGLMKESRVLGDSFWRLLFTGIRDRKSSPIDRNKTVPVLEGGHTRFMTMEDIEKKFSSENPHILTSFESVPDQMIHEDLIDAHFSTDAVKESLKRSYDIKITELKKEALSKTEKGEVEKQVAAQAKRLIKESREAKSLQNRVAMMAEDKVQKSIKQAMNCLLYTSPSPRDS